MKELSPEQFFSPQAEQKKSKAHIPEMLRMQEEFGEEGHIVDERKFRTFDPSIKDPDYFEKELAKDYSTWPERGPSYRRVSEEHDSIYMGIVSGLIVSLGRIPTPAEVQRERYRQRIFQQVMIDFVDNAGIVDSEVDPQREVIKKREKDFPSSDQAAEAFERGEVRAVTEDGVTRLYIAVPNKDGELVDHPVMTDEEIAWVDDSAKMIANSIEDKKRAKVFIAGLGLGLLNKKLSELGINNQVVAEINHGVIELVGDNLKQENKNLNLEIRQGDFKKTLEEAVENGERYDAISIDAFPNTAEEVNRDASGEDVLSLAYKALKPGGKLTFYPDSRYLPLRILKTLSRMGIPETSIHYTVAKFKTSEFTKGYHYGELMSVPEIQKPRFELKDEENFKELKRMTEEYYNRLEEELEGYVKKYAPKEELAAV